MYYYKNGKKVRVDPNALQKMAQEEPVPRPIDPADPKGPSKSNGNSWYYPLIAVGVLVGAFIVIWSLKRKDSQDDGDSDE